MMLTFHYFPSRLSWVTSFILELLAKREISPKIPFFYQKFQSFLNLPLTLFLIYFFSALHILLCWRLFHGIWDKRFWGFVHNIFEYTKSFTSFPDCHFRIPDFSYGILHAIFILLRTYFSILGKTVKKFKNLSF